MPKIGVTESKSEFYWQVLASIQPLDLVKSEFFATITNKLITPSQHFLAL